MAIFLSPYRSIRREVHWWFEGYRHGRNTFFGYRRHKLTMFRRMASLFICIYRTRCMSAWVNTGRRPINQAA